MYRFILPDYPYSLYAPIYIAALHNKLSFTWYYLPVTIGN